MSTYKEIRMTRFKLFRDETSQKDWAIMAQSDLVQIREGSTGGSLKLTEIPHKLCDGLPQDEMQLRIESIIRDNVFLFVDSVEINDRGIVMNYLTPNIGEEIHWSLFSDSSSNLDIRDVLQDTVIAMRQLDVKATFNEKGISINTYNVSFLEAGKNGINLDSGIGAGELTIEDGFIPVLWLQLLANKLKGSLSIVSSTNQTVIDNYLSDVGYFQKDNERFYKFAKENNFLSPVVEMLSKLDFELDAGSDWL